jgi:microtubule-associated protein-like 6
VKCELEWVHGFRGGNNKNNLSVLCDGSVSYHACAVGISYDMEEHTQRHFIGHQDDIISFAMDPVSKRIVATGELGPHPRIFIWDAVTMQQIHMIQGKFEKGVQSLAFSPDGKMLAGVDTHNDHHVGVYNAETGALVAFSKGDTALIVEIAFKNATELATAGVKHFKCWTLGSNLVGKKGQFGKNEPKIGSIKFNKDDGLSGNSKGELYIWKGQSISKTIKNHEKIIDAIHVTEEYVFTGGRDCRVCVLNA